MVKCANPLCGREFTPQKPPFKISDFEFPQFCPKCEDKSNKFIADIFSSLSNLFRTT